MSNMGGKSTRESETIEAEFVRVHKGFKSLVLEPCTYRISGVKRPRDSESESKSMEADEFSHVHKRPKTLMVLKSDDTDRISQLPDDILHRIVSFLPQDAVVKTLSVSKRWLNLWITLPFLCFEFRPDSYSETNTVIMNFIGKLLSCRDKSTSIEKFCLSSSQPNNCLDVARVNCLIGEAVLRHGVRELDLKLEHGGIQFLSPYHVSCHSLTSLKLWVNLSTKPNFPVSFSFPNLKTMFLRDVILGSNIASVLSNNCRKLENLTISRCGFDLVPNNNCRLRALPNLFKASLLMSFLHETIAFDFLPVISNVEVLSLKIDYPELFLDELEKQGYFSKFQHLKSLEFGRFVNQETRVNVIDRLLRSSPALESLSLDLFMYYGASEDLIPSCRLSEALKVIKLVGISPAKHLIELVKYFLEGAKGLEKMIVCKPLRTFCDEVQREDICQKLLALPNSGLLELCDDDNCGRGLYYS